MFSTRVSTTVCLMTFTFLVFSHAAASEIYSDLTTAHADEVRALDIKGERFWQPLKKAADSINLKEHVAIYARVEAALTELPAENTYVREKLTEALTRLRRADESVLRQAALTAGVASQKMQAPLGETPFSFLSGGQNFIGMMLRRFVNEGDYAERLSEHIKSRQADILPTLQNAANSLGNFLEDCRLSSKLSFDILKYDIYNKGVPKTPAHVEEIAYAITDAAAQTRRHFTKMIVESANSLANDVVSRSEQPSVTVVKSSLEAEGPVIHASDEKNAMEHLVNV